MKRLAAALLVLLASVLMAACANKDDGPAPATDGAEGPGSAEALRAEGHLTLATDPVTKPMTGDLDAMIERRTVRVLTVFSKTFYFIDNGVQRGASHDLGRMFVDDLNKKIAKDGGLKQKHLKVNVVFIPVTRGELLGALAAGKGDIAMGNITVTEERKEQVDFSSPVYPDVSEVVVSGPGSPEVSTVDDLAGKQVFVRKSSSYHESLVALNERFADEKLSAVIIKEAPEELEDEDLIEMVSVGLVPLIIVDKHIADFWKQVFPAITVHDDVAVRTGGSIAWAIRKDSPQLQAAVDDFVVRHAKGTSVGNQILAKYFKNTKHVKDAASEAERAKFRALRQYFEKYGQQYDVDWLLMAAQGYQESQLNQSVKSPVGAIGVMQVMPATGEELAVGDIREVEANIHAGVKYMRWMMDTYYDKEPMTPMNKALFAFASYNAGAGRISSLRKEAAKRGLDPNVWFNNVEIIAAEKIGAETATYVSNIYKYFVGYRLMTDAVAERSRAVEEMKEERKTAQ